MYLVEDGTPDVLRVSLSITPPSSIFLFPFSFCLFSLFNYCNNSLLSLSVPKKKVKKITTSFLNYFVV